jgi:Fe-S cluster biogenesis protein NfuA
VTAAVINHEYPYENGGGSSDGNPGGALRGRIEQIETLIEDLEACADPAALAHARAIVQAVLDFHGAALSRLLSHVAAAGTPGRAILDRLARDVDVSSLLLLHGLHPDELEVRVARALEQVRPQLRAHGGDVALLDLDQGIVRLRMQGTCHGCPSSALTLKNAIEQAIYNAAPDVTAIEVEGVAGPDSDGTAPLVTIGPLNTGGTP